MSEMDAGVRVSKSLVMSSKGCQTRQGKRYIPSNWRWLERTWNVDDR